MDDNDKTRLKAIPTPQLQERKSHILQSLPPLDHIIRGSLITRHIKCGKPNCHCATGTGHKSLYLSSFYRGRTYMDYVPAAWEAWVRKGLENYDGIQDLLSELTELNLELLRRREKS
ncbi:DUF6788 family protein [Paenibacillus koleovorans]|uniref:DUF6788 family protein n=1 Tax=Paenibacillus koleovorans TaxID=121608 RepID=UPI001C3FEFEC|nr:DUF6788 family protein [Paenibacillus koleovorans]